MKSCLWIIKNVLVCWDIILWVTGLLYYNGRWFITMLNVRWDINSWVRVTHNPRTLILPPAPMNNDDSTVQWENNVLCMVNMVKGKSLKVGDEIRYNTKEVDWSCLDIIQFHPTSNFGEYNLNRSLFVLKTSAVFYPGSLLLLQTVSTPTNIFFWLKTPINLIPEQLITYPQTWQVYVVQTNVSGSHFGFVSLKEPHFLFKLVPTNDKTQVVFGKFNG